MLEACKEKFRITLGFPIRHQYQIGGEPFHVEKMIMKKGTTPVF